MKLSKRYGIRPLTKEEAIEIHDSGAWKEWSHDIIANFQMRQDKLCMPFPVFHEALEKTLGRGVFTHEFAFATEPGGLCDELDGLCNAPTFEEIMALIPEEKRIIIQVEE